MRSRRKAKAFENKDFGIYTISTLYWRIQRQWDEKNFQADFDLKRGTADLTSN
jgi:hypothetical protein